jgi:hypothetical protein
MLAGRRRSTPPRSTQHRFLYVRQPGFGFSKEREEWLFAAFTSRSPNAIMRQVVRPDVARRRALMGSDGADPPNAGSASGEPLGGLGRLVETFRPNWGRLAFGGAFGLVLIGVGLRASVRYALGWCDTSRAANPELERWGIAGLGLVAAVGGFGLLLYVWHMGSSRMLLFESGVAGVRRGKATAVLWEDIAEVRERVTQVKLIKGPSALVPKATSGIYVIVRRDGAVLAFDADKVGRADRLAGAIEAECRRRGIPWHVSTTTH